MTLAPLAAPLALTLVAVAPAGAHELPAAETPDALPVRQALEPPLSPTPQADCGPGSRPETGVQGRVPPRRPRERARRRGLHLQHRA